MLSNGWTRDWEERREARMAAGGPSEEIIEGAAPMSYCPQCAKLETELREAKSGWDSAIADLRKAAEICRGVETALAAANERIEQLEQSLSAYNETLNEVIRLERELDRLKNEDAKYQELQRVYALVSHWHGEYDLMVRENEQLKSSMDGN